MNLRSNCRTSVRIVTIDRAGAHQHCQQIGPGWADWPHLCQLDFLPKGKLLQAQFVSTKTTQCLDVQFLVSKSLLIKLWGKEIKPRRLFVRICHGVLPRLASAALECSRALICNLAKSNWSMLLESFSGTCSIGLCWCFLPFHAFLIFLRNN